MEEIDTQKLGNKDSNGLLPALSFQPNFWQGKANVPTYYATYVRGGPGTQEGPPTSQEGVGSDFVVIVLDVPEDFDTSYLGSITYTTDWNNLDVWTHIGYPQIFQASGLLPYLEGPFPVINAYHPGFFHSEHGYAIRKSPVNFLSIFKSTLTTIQFGRKCSMYKLW